jgi:hypothetical protein
MVLITQAGQRNRYRYGRNRSIAPQRKAHRQARIGANRRFDRTNLKKVQSVQCNKFGFYLSNVTKLAFSW